MTASDPKTLPSTDPAAHPRGFASDNYAGAHPEVIKAIAAANVGHAPAYGADPWTARLAPVHGAPSGRPTTGDAS